MDVYSKDVVVAEGVEVLVVDDCARGIDLDDFAARELLRVRRQRELLADGDLASCVEQPLEIARGGVEGDAAHRCVPTPGQRQVQKAGDFDGVLAEHLIEVSEPEEEHLIGVLLLYLMILTHHGRQFPLPCHGAQYRLIVMARTMFPPRMEPFCHWKPPSWVSVAVLAQ